jgi:glycosyltransferase involved in cell wall biosynthesis
VPSEGRHILRAKPFSALVWLPSRAARAVRASWRDPLAADRWNWRQAVTRMPGTGLARPSPLVGSAAPADLVRALGATVVVEDDDPPSADAVHEATEVWVPNLRVQAQARRWWPEVTTVLVPSAVDPATFRPRPRALRPPGAAQRVVCTARPTWRSGAEDLLVALTRLRDDGMALRVDLVDDPGPGGEATRFAVHDLGIDEIVEFHRPRTLADVARLLGHADVFVLPAVADGAWTELREAISCGVRAVASDLPDLRRAASAAGGEVALARPRCPEDLVKAIGSLLAEGPGAAACRATA